MMKKAIIEIRNLRFSYGQTEILKGVDLSIRESEFVGIIGPNGSGKSTLIKNLSGFLEPDEGEIYVAGRKLEDIDRREAARLMAVVPQEFSFFFPFSVHDFVMMGRHPYQSLTSFSTEEDRLIVNQAMEETDTLRFKDRSVLELSGGEKQRVVLAAALAQNTGIICLDEPTSSLDLHFQLEIYSTLKRLCGARGLTVVGVTHDLNLGALFCDRLIMLVGGETVLDGPPEEIITPGNIARYYGVEVSIGINERSKKPFIVPIGG